MTPDNRARQTTRAPTQGHPEAARDTTACHLPALSRAKTVPRALRNPRQKSGLHPSGLIQLPLVSPAPKDHPHGKSQSPIHRVQADAQETWDKFSFLGKLAAPRSPPPPSSRPPLLLVSSTQTAGGLGGFTFGALQSRGPSVPTAGWVAGCRTGARQRELWRALQRTKESVPPPKPDPAPSLVPAQARLCRSQPPATLPSRPGVPLIWLGLF